MRDSEIIELYFARDEQAIIETDKAYGKYCQSIAGQILGNLSESLENISRQDHKKSGHFPLPCGSPQEASTYRDRPVGIGGLCSHARG